MNLTQFVVVLNKERHFNGILDWSSFLALLVRDSEQNAGNRRQEL